jgi:hypothetical protein
MSELDPIDPSTALELNLADQFENPVIRMEDLEGIRETSSWSGVHSWHFHPL